jgi:hypothetical protein
VIFDVRTVTERNARHEDIPGSLTVSKGDLPNLLKWLPPNSMVALSCGDAVERFGPQIESALLQLGIEAIYLLDNGINFPLTVTWDQNIFGQPRGYRARQTESSRA